MKHLTLVLAFLTAGCISGQSSNESSEEPSDEASGQSSHLYVEMQTDDLYSSVIEGHNPTDITTETNLIYVIEPSLSEWDTYCGTKDSPDWEAAEWVGKPCDVFWSVDNGSMFRYPSGAKSEIEEAFSPTDVQFVTDKNDVLVEGGRPPLPIKNGAGLISLGVALEIDGKIYMPVDMHGHGALIEATPTDSGWDLDTVMSWQT